MLNGLKINLSRLVMLSLLGLSLTGCSQSNGADYVDTGGGSESQAIAQPAARPNSDMSNMKMPEKSTSSRAKGVALNTVPNQVVIENFSFVPATLTIKPGTKVTWVNRDDVPHTATDTDKRFNSKTLDTDDQFSFTFSEAGTYSYYCALHPKMTGQIIVK